MATLDEWIAGGARRAVRLAARDWQIFVRTGGTGDWCTLLHGFPTSSFDWHRVWDVLRARRRVLAFDFLGFGDSDKPADHDYTIVEQADIAEALWQAQGVRRTALVVHDYGVSVAQELLARLAEGRLAVEVPLVVFLNGGLYPELHRPQPAQLLLLDPVQGPEVGKLVNEEAFGRSLAVTFSPAHQPGPEELHQLWLAVSRRDGHRIGHRLIQYIRDRQRHRDRWVQALETAPVPRHFLWGDLDPVSGAHMADRIAERVRGGELVRFPDVGHWPQLEASQAVAGHLERILGVTAAVTIRALREGDLDAADRIFRLAFGTFVQLPDPLAFAGDSSWVHTRWRADPSAAIAAELDGELVGSNFATCWGSIGFFGPLTVRPDLWNRGIARRLLEGTMPLFARAGVRHVGLYTFAESPKHLALYQRFGFWPRFLTAVLEGPPDGPACHALRWSRLSRDEQPRLLGAARALTDAVHPGLDVTREIRAVEAQGLGDVVALGAIDALDGLAICHCGAGSEAGSGACYVKFGAVRPGSGGTDRFAGLVDACAALARDRGLARLVIGINTARRTAYRHLLARGLRTDLLGIAMHRGDDPMYDHAEALVIDDWR